MKNVVKKHNVVPKTNMDVVRKMKHKLRNIGGGDNKWWKPSDGTNVVRIFPSNVPAHAGIPAGGFLFHSCLHYGFKDANRNRAYPCLDHIEQPPCPVCRFISKYGNETDPDVQGLIKRIKPSSQFLVNMIDRNAKVPRIQIWSMPPGVSKDLINHMSDPDYGDITDPEEGHDLKLERENNKGRISYSITPRPKPSDCGVEHWQDQLFNLAKEAYIEVPTYAQYVEMMKSQFSDYGFDFDFLFKTKVEKKKMKLVDKENEELSEEEDDVDTEEEDDEDEGDD